MDIIFFQNFMIITFYMLLATLFIYIIIGLILTIITNCIKFKNKISLVNGLLKELQENKYKKH